MALELPKPWIDLGTLPVDEQAALEATIGSRLTEGDLSADEVEVEADTKRPLSPRAFHVMSRKWVKVRNGETDVEVVLRLQGSTLGDGSWRASAVAVTFDPAHELSGADLRNVPVAALSAAYSAHRQGLLARTLIDFALGKSGRPDPLAKLPRDAPRDELSALVALQYEELERRNPGKTVAPLMQELNDVPLPTIQRWIARSRKLGMLAPHMPKTRS